MTLLDGELKLGSTKDLAYIFDRLCNTKISAAFTERCTVEINGRPVTPLEIRAK